MEAAELLNRNLLILLDDDVVVTGTCIGVDGLKQLTLRNVTLQYKKDNLEITENSNLYIIDYSSIRRLAYQ